MSHDRLATVEAGRRPSYDAVRGSELPQRPAEVDIWHDAVVGSGRQTLVVPADDDLSVVIMRSDGTEPVEAEIRAGTRQPWLDDLALVLFKIGMNLGGAGALGLWAALRPRR